MFLKYVLNSVEFENDEHEKAWFIRVTINACKYLIKSFFRSKTVPLDEILTYSENISNDKKEVLEAVLSLPLKYKNVVYLHLIESLSNSNDIEFGNGQGNWQCNERGNGQGNGQCNGQGKMQGKNFNN